jgi:hypothetical protein
MIICEMPQQTDLWYAEKAGLPSASNFDKIITIDGKPSKQREKYMFSLAAERVTGKKEDTFQSFSMQRGVELEAEARQYYELINDCEVRQVGLCYPNEDKKYGCSPDGIVGDDGGLEIKCPTAAVHVGYLLDGKLPSDYFQQVHGSLLVTGRKWWDFLSYYPGIKPLLIRVEPDKKFIAALEVELEKFCLELNALVEKIR